MIQLHFGTPNTLACIDRCASEREASFQHQNQANCNSQQQGPHARDLTLTEFQLKEWTGNRMIRILQTKKWIEEA